MNREQFLGRLRERLGHEAGATVPPAPHPSPAYLSKAAAHHPAGRFVARLRELEVTVFTVVSREEARASADALLRERGWAAACAPASLRWGELPAAWVDDPAGADFGLAEADLAIAETGTVVLLNGGEAARGHSLLSPASGFFVPASRVVPYLRDALQQFSARPEGLPACVSFVSGPSNTADISGVRCVGVHGPGEVFVWLIAAE